ncbi:DNA-binding response regulator [Halomonas vilamensis]|uniref:DNA-binding response regulator n=1 Tax=Vreelandella vilamensis TaxID=531309 RepID=A0ABU1H5G1_9GAMM|nr:DNA-binding response regulator [Halomonas vilamensis]MDR5899539.1 DNA-binding response regulator [Halomonas vilamensis]
MRTHDYVLIVLRNVQTGVDDDYHKALECRGYRLETVFPGQDPSPWMSDKPPVAACFQYDYPDFTGLASLRETKQAFPSIPLLMITQAHSEHLAVWAFRARVWDYFVQPFDMTRFLEVMEKLYAVRLPEKSKLTDRNVVEVQNQIPPEARLYCTIPGDDQARLQRVISFIDLNLHRKIVQSEAAGLCGLGPFQFSRFFKRVAGITFQEYLLHRRISEAMRLLANPKVSITDVCFTVGFSDLSYFTRIFQRYVGKPPSRYRLENMESASTQSKDAFPSPPTTLPDLPPLLKSPNP